MGSGEALSDIADQVEISGSTCLELRKSEQYRSAPFVKINDTVGDWGQTFDLGVLRADDWKRMPSNEKTPRSKV